MNNAANYYTITKYNGTIVPRNFEVSNTLFNSNYIESVGMDLSKKSIQYVSFIKVKNLKYVNRYYYQASSGSSYKANSGFSNNEIRKIYWNSDDFYLNNIEIWENAFLNNKLQSLDLPDKVINIKASAFQNNEISWMNWGGVKEIGSSAFENNKLVSYLPNGYKFEIPKSMSILPSRAFYNNELTHVDIPENIINVGSGVFGENPITSIYFENANTVINNDFLSDEKPTGTWSSGYFLPTNISDIIIYGHGDTSTAANYAKSSGAKYVNVDQYENAVFDAEEAFSEQKLNEAYIKINVMEDGEMKEGYLERLDNLNGSFEIAKYVEKAEQTLNKQDYQFAKARVSEMPDGVPKTNMNNRLNLVLKAINGARINEIKQMVNSGGDIDLSLLNEMQGELAEIGGSDAESLKAALETKRYDAEIDNYKNGLSYIKHAKEYPTIKNVTNAQKIINLLSDDFKFLEDVTMTYNDPYLKDINGDYAIDEDASYQKKIVTEIDPDTGVSVDKEEFEVDINGDKILKDGLTQPIYINDPLYGQEYIIKKEKGSKKTLQDSLNEFSDIVYAKAAIEIAEKYLSQEKLDDALILTLSLEEGSEKDELRLKIENVQKEVDKIEDEKKEIEEMIQEYSITGETETYNQIIDKINGINNEEVKKEMNKKVKLISYEKEFKKLIDDAEEKGFVKSSKEKAIAYLALIGEENLNYNDYLNQLSKLVNEYNNYDQQYLDLMKEINDIDRTDKISFTKDVYNSLKEKVFKVKENNPNKAELINEISKLFDDLNALGEKTNQYDLIEEELQFTKSNFKEVTTEELKLLSSKITQVENKTMRNELKKEFDDVVKTVVEDHLIPEYQKPENFTPDFKDDILSYIYLVNDTGLKNSLKSKVENKIYDIIVGDILINMDGPDVIRDTNVEGYKVNLDDMIKMLQEEALKDNVNSLVDDKIINEIQNNYTDGSGNPKSGGDLSKEELLLLGQMQQAISDLSKQLAQKDFVNNIATEYFQTSYPNITNNNGDYTMNDYKDMSQLTPYFDGIHINEGNGPVDINQVVDNSLVNNIKKNLEDNRSYDVAQAYTDIGAIINQDARAEMNNYLQDYVSNAVQNFDLSKPTSLTSLTDLGDQIQHIDDSEIQMKLGDILSSYVEDNAKTIYDTATQNNMDSQMMQFLSDYLSQDEISKLYNMDHDNVIGNQSNNKPLTSTTVNKGNDDMNKLYEALENLQKIVDGLKQQSNVLQDSSVNTIDGDSKAGNNFNSQQTSGVQYNGGGSLEHLLNEMGINEELANNQMTIQQLQDQIEELQKDNEDLFSENIVALKAAAAGNDQNVQKQLETYKDGNKTFNNVLIGLGASMWLLILLGLMYNANLNLRNKKRIEAIDENIIEIKDDSKETKEKITELELKVNELIDYLKNKEG